MLSSMEARIAFGSKSSAQNSSCLFAQERLNFAASGKAGGEVCVRDLFGSGLGFVKQSMSRLESLNFKIYRIA
nr:hypothetical protein [uncultured Campylobacter sp.]